MIDDSNLITPRDWVIIVIFFVLRERTRERVFDIHSELPVGFFDGTTLTILCSSARTLISNDDRSLDCYTKVGFCHFDTLSHRRSWLAFVS